MKIRRVLTVGLAAGALVLAGCSTGEDDGGGRATETAVAAAAVAASRPATSASTSSPTRPGDSFWDVVKSGAEQAGDDYGVDLQYHSDPDPGKQSTLIDTAVAAAPTVSSSRWPTPTAWRTASRQPWTAGVPVITINSGIDQWQDFGAITHVGQSETIAGRGRRRASSTRPV